MFSALEEQRRATTSQLSACPAICGALLAVPSLEVFPGVQCGAAGWAVSWDVGSTASPQPGTATLSQSRQAGWHCIQSGSGADIHRCAHNSGD